MKSDVVEVRVGERELLKVESRAEACVLAGNSSGATSPSPNPRILVFFLDSLDSLRSKPFLSNSFSMFHGAFN